MSDLPKKILQLGQVGQDELRKSYSLTVPPASNLVYELGLINPSNLNSSVNYFIDLGDIAVHTMRNNLALLSQLISEPAFNQLRTVEQLGYIVQTYSRRCPAQCGWVMCIQSEKPPAFVESRIEEFLHWFLDEKLVKMDEEEFMAQKKSLVNKITEDFKNLWEETSHYWTHIDSGYYSFEQRHLDAELILKITKQEMVDFYRTYIHPSSPTRAKLSVQVRSQKVPVPAQILEALIPSSSSDDEPKGWKALVQRKPDLTELFKFLDDHGLSDKKQVVMDAVDGYDKVGDRFLDHTFLVNKPVVVPSRGEGINGIEGSRTRFGRSAVVGPVPDWKASIGVGCTSSSPSAFHSPSLPFSLLVPQLSKLSKTQCPPSCRDRLRHRHTSALAHSLFETVNTPSGNNFFTPPTAPTHSDPRLSSAFCPLPPVPVLPLSSQLLSLHFFTLNLRLRLLSPALPVS